MSELVRFGGAIIGIILVVAVVTLICWVIISFMAMKFCQMAGNSKAAMVWIPLPGIQYAVVVESMIMVGSLNGNPSVVMGMGYGAALCTLLQFVPKVGGFFGIISSILSIILGFCVLMGIFKTCKMVGKSGILYLLLTMFVPVIGLSVTYNAMTKGLSGYADNTYGEY